MAGDADQNLWKDNLKEKFPQYFKDCRICEIGSANMNGTNQPWFENCVFTGVDIAPYDNVTVVSIAHEYDAPNESFDVVCSTSELEHDIHWKKTLQKMVDLLKPGGFMWFDAPHVWNEHGTKRDGPCDSLTSDLDSEWADYYKNVNIEDIRSVLDLDKIFEKHEIFYATKVNQPEVSLRFWGIKKND